MFVSATEAIFVVEIVM